jgi:hypothetical protein
MRLQSVSRVTGKRAWVPNVYTGESFNDAYWQSSRYVAARLACGQLNVMLRDHRSGVGSAVVVIRRSPPDWHSPGSRTVRFGSAAPLGA